MSDTPDPRRWPYEHPETCATVLTVGRSHSTEAKAHYSHSNLDFYKKALPFSEAGMLEKKVMESKQMPSYRQE